MGDKKSPILYFEMINLLKNLPLSIAIIIFFPIFLIIFVVNIGEGSNPFENLQNQVRFQTIVIDPGHGGKDSGAIGPSGLKEKDVALEVALKLKNLIKKNLGIRVILTRTGDYIVPLEERTAIANNNKADIFISIHVGASINQKVKGFNTYSRGLKTNDLEEIEDELIKNQIVDSSKLIDTDSSDLKFILWSDVQTPFLYDSIRLAESIQNSYFETFGIKTGLARQIPLFILEGTRMPSLLTEIGFITNPQEENQLQNNDFLEQVATALYKGILMYSNFYEIEPNEGIDSRE